MSWAARYERWWNGACCITVVVCLGTTALLGSAAIVASAAAGITALAGVGLYLLGGVPAQRGRPEGARLRLRLALLSGPAVVAFSGLFRFSPAITVALLIALFASAPRLHQALRRLAGPPPPSTSEHSPGTDDEPPGEVDRSPSPGTLSACALDDLCRCWRATYWRLVDASSSEEAMEIVSFRRELLDELVRRSPTAMACWFQSGARASGGPERYLSRDDPVPRRHRES